MSQLRTLGSPAGATLGSPANATLVIRDEPAPVVRFAAGAYAVTEGQGSVAITATLNEASSQTVTVNYATADWAAAAGQDYTATSGTLTFLPGQTTAA
ncbi:MAG TPA: Calx-beta domain-containing protein, partial [Urbifossiella sp.]|nr:Calx-beta domain-containing protein [Urbifossiella sp.]